jgi:predicted GNAT superfamily acetyltransferase
VKRVLAAEPLSVDILEHVEVPTEIAAWKATDADRAKARAVQQANAAALQDAFARGLAVVGYERSERGDGRFLLGVASEPAY